MLDLQNTEKVINFVTSRVHSFGKRIEYYCNALIDETNGTYWFVLNQINKKAYYDKGFLAAYKLNSFMTGHSWTKIKEEWVVDNEGTSVYWFDVDLFYKECPVFCYLYIADCNNEAHVEKNIDAVRKAIISRVLIPAILTTPKEPDDIAPLFDFTIEDDADSIIHMFKQCVDGRTENTIKMLEVLFDTYGNSNGFERIIDRLIRVSTDSECTEVTAYLLNMINKTDDSESEMVL